MGYGNEVIRQFYHDIKMSFKYSETQATGLWVGKKGNEVNIDQLRDII